MWEKFVALDLYTLHICMMFRSRYVILADSTVGVSHVPWSKDGVCFAVIPYWESMQWAMDR